MLKTRMPINRLLVSLLAVRFLVSPLLLADSYRVTKQSDGFSYESALINNSGVVLFTGLRGDKGTGKTFRGVYKGRGGDIKTIVESPAFEFSPDRIMPNFALAINDAGVAVVAGDYQGHSAYFQSRGSIGPEDLIALVFRGQPVVLTSADSTYRDYLCQTCSGSVFSAVLNARNEYLQNLGDRIALVKVGLNASPDPAGREAAPLSTNFLANVSTDAAMLNDRGTVAYSLHSGEVSGIYTTSGATVVEQRPGSEFLVGRLFALNNADQVAFSGRSQTLGKSGFFRGSNPLTDKIVAEGDIVAGTRLFSFALVNRIMPERWFNDVGQVVFLATDEQGFTGLYVADSGISPAPPASTVIAWDPAVSPPNGSFSVANNWKPENTDPPRVPQKTTTLNDTALFDRPETYTVDLGTQRAERLLVKDGNVLLVNGSLNVDAVAIDNAKLTLSTAMSLTNNDALIGNSAASRVDVGFGGDWVNLGSLRVGGAGEGILEILPGGTVTSGEARIGGAGQGHAMVSGTGKWTTGHLALGIDGGKGELTISDGATVDSNAAVIGQEASLGNKVTVQGRRDTSSSFWQVGSLEVGGGETRRPEAGAGTGQLDVKDGGWVDTLVLKIGRKIGVTGSVTVSGVNADSTPSKISVAALQIGDSGVGELRIEDGGKVEAGVSVSLGQGPGNALVTVTGINAVSGLNSSLEVAGPLVVGDIFAAMMLIEAGGTVHSDSGHVAGGAVSGAVSEVKIVGSSSGWIVDDKLIIGLDFEPSSAVISLVGGTIEADSIEVNNGGKIQGFGHLSVPLTDRVVNSGGTISPGLSPGTITIQGNYEQRAGGRLLMEIGGTNSAEYDHLIIKNAAALDGNVTFRFINGFAPKTGQQFDFLSVGGALSNSFARVALQNLAPGFQFKIAPNGTALTMTALSDAVFSPALPGTVKVTMQSIGGITYASYAISTTKSCQTITAEAAPTRAGNVFTQVFQGTTFVGGECQDQLSATTNVVVLGALASGDYIFNVTSAGQTIDTVSFNVPPVSPRTFLTPTRLPDRSVQLTVAGLAPITSTIEVSDDLITWADLGSGTLPLTLTDYDATILPRRYYRARIGS